ncbi:MAG TPA: hypothetical protein VFK52_04705 [Nocardioidaceae bacterium]|nr:hypothetical protein [Nocardioidaceae bacterium]
MHNDAPTTSRRARLGRHLRRNVVGYVALLIAVSMTPLPSWAAATIGTADIKNGAVTTKKIKNSTIKKLDIAPGARGYTAFKTAVGTASAVPAGESRTINVDCGTNRVAVGGGGYHQPTGFVVILGSTSGAVTRSHPVNQITFGGNTYWAPAGADSSPRGWRTVVQNTSAEDRTLYAYAICASK